MKRALFALLIAPLLALAACGGPSAAQFPDNEDGAKRFAEYTVSVVREAAASLDTSKLEAISAPECDGCADTIRSFKGFAEDGSRFEGVNSRFTAEKATKDDVLGFYTVEGTLTTDPGKLINRDGGIMWEVSGGQVSTFIEVKFVDGTWWVSRMD